MVRGESIFTKAQDSSMPGLANQSDDGMTPQELAAFSDHHRKMMDVLDDETLQEVVTMRMEGSQVHRPTKPKLRAQIGTARRLMKHRVSARQTHYWDAIKSSRNARRRSKNFFNPGFRSVPWSNPGECELSR